MGKDADVNQIQEAEGPEPSEGEGEVEGEERRHQKQSNKFHVQLQRTENEPEQMGNHNGSRQSHIEKVNIDDAEEANKILDILMGSKSAPKIFHSVKCKLAEIDQTYLNNLFTILTVVNVVNLKL